jgi:hypothetical protein
MKYKIMYALDDDATRWKTAHEGVGLIQSCCDFQQLTFSAKHSRHWRLQLTEAHGHQAITMQYLEFQIIGKPGPTPMYSKSDPFIPMGNGLCAMANNNTKANHKVENNHQNNCRSLCAADPMCPGFVGQNAFGKCLWYTEIFATVFVATNLTVLNFDIRNTSVSDEEWKDSPCFRKASPCPPHSEGFNVETGCKCAAGYTGVINRTTSRPWYTGGCRRAPCPGNSTLIGGKAGSCFCDEGFSGMLVNTYTSPFYSGKCRKIDVHVWTTSTTTTIFAPRYWGLAAGGNTAEWYYEPHKFDLFTRSDGHGQSLTTDQTLVGLFPGGAKGIEHKTFEPLFRKNSTFFLSLYSGTKTVEALWPGSWDSFRKPLYYVDFGEGHGFDVRSAKHKCWTWKRCLNKAYIVSSDDGIKWTQRLVSHPKHSTFNSTSEHELINEPYALKARYWGLASARLSESGQYALQAMQFYENRNGTGTDLAEGLALKGGSPAPLAGKTFAGGPSSLPILRNTGATKDWWLAWPKYQKPNFYVDMGEPRLVRSARHIAKREEDMAGHTIVVSSDDQVNWRARFTTEEPQLQQLIEQDIAKCDTMACPSKYRPRRNFWALTCLSVRCRIGRDRDACCEPRPGVDNKAKGNASIGGGLRDWEPHGEDQKEEQEPDLSGSEAGPDA